MTSTVFVVIVSTGTNLLMKHSTREQRIKHSLHTIDRGYRQTFQYAFSIGKTFQITFIMMRTHFTSADYEYFISNTKRLKKNGLKSGGCISFMHGYKLRAESEHWMMGHMQPSKFISEFGVCEGMELWRWNGDWIFFYEYHFMLNVHFSLHVFVRQIL
jgi:hypothetical protein